MGIFGRLGRSNLSLDGEIEWAIGEMKAHGTINEQRKLSQVIEGFKKIIPKRMGEKKEIEYRNLFTDVVNLWSIGKWELVEIHREWYAKEMKTKYHTDIKHHQLFELAIEVMDDHNQNSRAVANNKQGFPEKFIQTYIKQIGYNDALAKANELYKMIPKEKFEETEIDLQNLFKTWRDRERKRKR
jgi:hypothetical protein